MPDARSEARASSSRQTEPLACETFSLSEEAEVGLEIEARSPGASWKIKGAEAAALRIAVDGEYRQDLLMWAGDEPFTYRVLLGRMPQGNHTVSVTLDRARSAAGAQRAEVSRLKTIPFYPTRNADGSPAADALAISYAPVLYARANSIDRFTDVPLLMYYQLERGVEGDTIIRYTAIFSHEDGGTPAAALMARWGRATDIEWVYQFRVRSDGRVVEEIYQGVEHQTKTFDGTRAFGQHPLLAVASDNNNFSALACSAVRFAPLPFKADLSAGSRETVMDAHPWTYRVMAEELQREQRLADSPTDLNTISDPRRYLYIEAYAEQEGTAISFDVEIAGDSRKYRSDGGDARLRIDRSGFFRSAVRLPAGVSQHSLAAITVRCHRNDKLADMHICRRVKFSRVFTLDHGYTPHPLNLTQSDWITLKAGDSMSVRFARPR